MPADGDLESRIGVQAGWQEIDYFWHPIAGSNLRAAGMTLGTLPDDVLIAPELDMHSVLFEQKPAAGACQVESTPIVPEETATHLRIYVDVECTEPDHDGSSWEMAYRSLNDAIAYLAELTAEEVGGRELEVYVMEGDLYPRYYFTNLDPKTANIYVPKNKANSTIRIYGGYSRADLGQTRDPLKYRSMLDGNSSGTQLSDGIYHVINVDAGAQVEFDGFHITGGNAIGGAALIRGGGMLVHDKAIVTLRNCMIDNCTAHDGAAVDARGATLTLENCVVSNNTSIGGDVLNAHSLTMNHVTLIHNLAKAATYRTMGGTTAITNSLSTGNYSAYTDDATNTPLTDAITVDVPVTSENFTNPTNTPGATFGYDTYVGGYPVFRPLTSSQPDADLIINKGTSGSLTTDIAGLGRNLGGVPDLGAYEADLPEAGRVYYVRTPEDGGDDNHDGLSWETAFQTIRRALQEAEKGAMIAGAKPSVWVAAGEYRQDPLSGSYNCFEIVEGVNVYGAFPKTGTPGMDDRHPFISDAIYQEDDVEYQPADYETILTPDNPGTVNSRVLGQSDAYNPAKESATYNYKEVGEENGNYIYYSEDTYVFVGENQGDYVYREPGYYEDANGSYKESTTAGELWTDTDPSLYNCLWMEQAGYYKITDDPTHAYCSTESDAQTAYEDRSGGSFIGLKYFVRVGSGNGDYNLRRRSGSWRNNYQYTDVGSGNGEWVEYVNGQEYYYAATSDYATHRLLQSGVYTGDAYRESYNASQTEAGYNYVGAGYGTHRYEAESFYENVGAGRGDYKRIEAGYEEVEWGKGNYIYAASNRYNYPTEWNGFTIKGGRLNSHGFPLVPNGGGTARNGGAGALIFTNVSLRNCIVTDNRNTGADASNDQLRGGGVYCDEGSLINCYIVGNQIGNTTWTALGAGAYMYKGTAYNCVISGNESFVKDAGGQGASDGAGIFIENAEFYNNTVVGNKSKNGVAGIGIYNSSTTGSKLILYNCISLDNTNGNKTVKYGNRDIGITGGGTIECYSSIIGEYNNQTSDAGGAITYTNTKKGTTAMFANYAEGNYRLNGTFGINSGENMPTVNGQVINLFEYTDMDYTDRIKDCTIDAGAYEYGGLANVACDADGVYYVNQNGVDIASGSSPETAACAMKLQLVLNAAGERVKSGKYAEVRIAGYEGASFAYHPNTLSDPNDPQSYTYTVPYGVVVKGGYDQVSFDDEPYSADNPDGRYPAVRMTVFSPIVTKGKQEIEGYHAVTFGEKPADWTGSAEVAADARTIIDGLYLEDGHATATTTLHSRGGGAVVPAWGHVRNCVVSHCEATIGGGLYLEPGAMVSGTAVLENFAKMGGGIYAAAESLDGTVQADKDHRSHLVSNTVGDNEAKGVGGGIYLEDGAAMALNTVVWGNTAPADKNVSGVLSITFKDAVWKEVFATTGAGTNAALTDFYPFDNSFVETYEMPAHFINTAMKSDGGLYFTCPSYRLKIYSPLIKTGMESDFYQVLIDSYGVADRDMYGLFRVQTQESGAEKYDHVDAGAYAYEGGDMPLDDPIYRLFVSHGTPVQLSADAPEPAEYYKGRSFRTPIPTLDEALVYIRRLQESNEVAKERTFEILMAGGTYKPTYRRTDADSEGIDQRQSSFVIPPNVRIYGGFSGEELYAYGVDEIPAVSGKIKMIRETEDDVQAEPDILANRIYSDLNSNNILEPWELGNQTILSGKVNVSDTVKNVYHVIFSRKSTEVSGHVLLDGLTIMEGETESELTPDEESNEIGRGGGIFSNGVEYWISRCRLLRNKGVRGGGLYALSAPVVMFGSYFAGNTATLGAGGVENVGGAICFSGTGSSLRAVNTLWVNNEATSYGGAIATDVPPADATTPILNLMNNTMARNKAANGGAIYIRGKGRGKIVNTLVWGNESSPGSQALAGSGTSNFNISYSASEEDWLKPDGTNKNISLNATDNMAVDGPRFSSPSGVAGIDGYDAKHIWSPAAISVLADFGNGKKAVADDTESGAYTEWFTEGGYKEYFRYYMKNKSGTDYERYNSSLDDDGKKQDATIDIGLYEFQYSYEFPFLDTIYVDVVDAGLQDGTSWGNATSDLKGAITALANPQGGTTPHKAILIRTGDYDYAISQLSTGGIAFVMNMSDIPDKEEENFGTSLTIKGSYDATGRQQFDKPTVITPNPVVKDETQWLMSANANQKQVMIEGIRFINNSKHGNALSVSTSAEKGDMKGQITLKNLGFRHNAGTAVRATNAPTGKTLIVNTLFADALDETRDGVGVGLEADANTTVVNATFVHNKVDYTGDASFFNSISWQNDTQHIGSLSDNTTNHNVASMAENTDIISGPNFVNPNDPDVMQRNYNIRPGMLLFNKGSNELYSTQVGVDPTNDLEMDLASGIRVVNGTIDIGAYEYNAPIRPILYVKSGVVGGDGSGSSWQNAMNDLQSASNLAGIYYDVNKDIDNEERLGYVFVHHNYDTDKLQVSLPGTKIYGNMNDELSASSPEDETAELTDPGLIRTIVSDLVGKRRGVLEAGTEHSVLKELTVSAASMLDGFEVRKADVSDGGMLSTSIVDVPTGETTPVEDVYVSREGILYNTFVNGRVYTVDPAVDPSEKPGYVVNVTATAALDFPDINKINSIEHATENAYITEPIWNYQLNEKSPYIDQALPSTVETYMDRVGHSRDLAGNPRVLNSSVDNGCFETWNVPQNAHWTTTADSRPINNHSVVYLHEGASLSLEQPTLFAPAYLLLKDSASLYASASGVGDGNTAVQLRSVGVEKALGTGWNMVSVPYALPQTGVQVVEEYSADGIPTLAGVDNGNMLVYDGNKCAESLYKFHNSDSPFWISPATTAFRASEGFALNVAEAPADDSKAIYRFTASADKSVTPVVPVYTEMVGQRKTVELTQYNRRTVAADGTPHFTYKENMGWNLFGIPYLVSNYNLEQMDIPHVVYPYDPAMMTYATIQSWKDGGSTADEKTASVGAAIFTQTAVLGDGTKELLYFPQPERPEGIAGKSRTMSLLSLEGEEGADRLAFRTRSDASAGLDFTPGSDGLKLMAERADAPQLYAQNLSGTRFALLDGVNPQAAIAVSVRTLSGRYSLSLADAADADSEEEVWLTDHLTRRTVNLKQESYSFDADGTDGDSRFTISFRRGDLPVGLITIYVEGHTLYVEGLESGSLVDIYDTAGRRLSSEHSTSEIYTRRLEPGSYLVKTPGEAARKVVITQ